MKENEYRRYPEGTYDKDAVSQILFYIVSVISMFLLGDTFFICGEGQMPVRIYQLIYYVPHAIFLLIVPFLNLSIFQDRSPRSVKLIKYAVTAILFTGCLLFTLNRLVPQLTTLYGSVQCSSWCFPAVVYAGLIMGCLLEFGRGSTTASTAG